MTLLDRGPEIEDLYRQIQKATKRREMAEVGRLIARQRKLTLQALKGDNGNG